MADPDAGPAAVKRPRRALFGFLANWPIATKLAAARIALGERVR